MTKVVIIGFGKVGSHLYNVLKTIKGKFLISVINSSHSKINKKNLSNADLILICTQDYNIRSAVKKIIKTGISLKGKIAAHTSGAFSSDEISVLKKNGCAIASFHPVQTFHRKAKPKDNFFKNIYVAIEGDTKAVKILNKLSRSAGSVPVLIDKNFKSFHHICCVISSGYITAGLSVIRDIYTLKNGFNKVNFFNIYKPLILNTISNITSEGIEKSLTGPIVRNDIKTIINHINTLKTLNRFDIIEYYRFMGLKSLKIAYKKGLLTKKQIIKLEKLLKSVNNN